MAAVESWVNTTCPVCRRTCSTGNQHHASMGRVLLVLFATSIHTTPPPLGAPMPSDVGWGRAGWTFTWEERSTRFSIFSIRGFGTKYF